MSAAGGLAVLSAGAAKAVVLAVAAQLREREGVDVTGEFDAAGAIRARFASGAPCDVLILPAAMLADVATSGAVDARSQAPLGDVPTGVAVAAGSMAPALHDTDALREALVGASALYCPDTERSTAGIHFVQMLRSMGIYARVAARIRDYANGAQAMAALAALDAGRERALGCTQVTEILYTPGVSLCGTLPAPFELTTTYSAAIATSGVDRTLAARLVAALTAPDTRRLREASGFVQRQP